MARPCRRPARGRPPDGRGRLPDRAVVSIASAPEQRGVALTVERIDGGEASPYLVGELRTGELLELRGPIGGHFVWRASDGGPLLLVGGGSGLVPLMSMARHHAASGSSAQLRLLASARTYESLLYAAELTCLGAAATRTVSVTLTRDQPSGWEGFSRRADAAMLATVARGLVAPKVFVCGPTAFVETVADALVANGHPPSRRGLLPTPPEVRPQRPALAASCGRR